MPAAPCCEAARCRCHRSSIVTRPTPHVLVLQWNLTCTPLSARAKQLIVGPELMFWDDAGRPCGSVAAIFVVFVQQPRLHMHADARIRCIQLRATAADISATDIILMLMSSFLPVAESGWSPQSVVAPLIVNPSRYQNMRCRLARRGMQSHDAYGHVGTFCQSEYDAPLMPWSLNETTVAPQVLAMA